VKSKKLKSCENTIINLDRDDQGGTHWVCYSTNKNRNYNCYFDSYGLPPSDLITKFVKSNGKKSMYNDGEIQMLDSIMCGYYCLYLLHKMNKGRSFEAVLTDFKEEPEMINEKIIKKFGGQLNSAFEGLDQNGDGIWQSIWNKYRVRACPKSRKLLDGEKHTGCKNFCGPGTRIDLPQVKNHPPSDPVDAVCKNHDLAYFAAKDLQGDELHKAIRAADQAMLSELERIGETRNINYAGIKAKMLAEKTKLGKTVLSKTLGPQYVGGQLLTKVDQNGGVKDPSTVVRFGKRGGNIEEKLKAVIAADEKRVTDCATVTRGDVGEQLKQAYAGTDKEGVAATTTKAVGTVASTIASKAIPIPGVSQAVGAVVDKAFGGLANAIQNAVNQTACAKSYKAWKKKLDVVDAEIAKAKLSTNDKTKLKSLVMAYYKDSNKDGRASTLKRINSILAGKGDPGSERAKAVKEIQAGLDDKDPFFQAQLKDPYPRKQGKTEQQWESEVKAWFARNPEAKKSKLSDVKEMLKKMNMQGKRGGQLLTKVDQNGGVEDPSTVVRFGKRGGVIFNRHIVNIWFDVREWNDDEYLDFAIGLARQQPIEVVSSGFNRVVVFRRLPSNAEHAQQDFQGRNFVVRMHIPPFGSTPQN